VYHPKCGNTKKCSVSTGQFSVNLAHFFVALVLGLAFDKTMEIIQSGKLKVDGFVCLGTIRAAVNRLPTC
jgi:hypothetical protein